MHDSSIIHDYLLRHDYRRRFHGTLPGGRKVEQEDLELRNLAVAKSRNALKYVPEQIRAKLFKS